MVSDRGVGFDSKAAKVSPGLGLVSMEERLKLLREPLQSNRSPNMVQRSARGCLSVRETIPCGREHRSTGTQKPIAFTRKCCASAGWGIAHLAGLNGRVLRTDPLVSMAFLFPLRAAQDIPAQNIHVASPGYSSVRCST